MISYSIHLHDGGLRPPRSTHISADDDDAARTWAIGWLQEHPAFSYVSITDGLRHVGKYARTGVLV